MGFKIACGLALVLCALRAAYAGPAEGAAAPTTVATPAGDDVAQAKAHYERGMAHFQLDEYEQAIEQWEAGFRVKRDPAFLYNIAQAYRLSKNAEKALSFYGKFLKMSPKAANRAEVERHMAALDKLIKDQQKAASQPPTHAARATMPGLSGDSPSSTAAAAATAPAKAEPAKSTSGRPGRATTDVKDGPAAAPTVVTTPAQTTPATSPTQTPPAASPAPEARTPAVFPTAPAPQPSQPAALVTAPGPAPSPEKPFYSRPLFWGIVGAAVVIGSAAAAIVLLSDSQKIDRLPDVSFR